MSRLRQTPNNTTRARVGKSTAPAPPKAITFKYYMANRTHLFTCSKKDAEWLHKTLGLESGEELTINFRRRQGQT